MIRNLISLGHVKHFGGQYSYSYKFHMPKNIDANTGYFDDETKDSRVLIQCGPKNSLWRFMRIEFNPSKIFMLELVALIEAIVPEESYTELMLKAFVNRMDLTVDVQNVLVDLLYFYCKNASLTNVLTKSGKTIKLGGDSSPSQFCLYNKVAEIIAKNGKKDKKLKDVVPPYDISRIELRLREKKMRLEDYMVCQNPFTRLSVWKFPKKAWSELSLNKLILKVAKYEGLQTALLLVKRSERRAFEKCAKPFLCEFWKPDDIWKELPNVIGGILDPSAYYKPL